MLKRIISWPLVFTAGAFSLLLSQANAEQGDIGLITMSADDASTQVRQACPKVWEDPGVPIDDELESIWGLDAAAEHDREEYSQFLTQLPEAGSSASGQDPHSDIESVIVHCTMARTALLSIFYSSLPQNVVASMPELKYKPGPAVDGFLVGDIRFTARSTPAKGWIFLEGQTVGANSEKADIYGEEYKKLFEVARDLHPNNSATEWGGNNIVRLPDMRGKVIAGASNSDLGAQFGQRSMPLTLNEMPRHNHATHDAGQHRHSIYNDTHSHALRTSQFTGASIANHGGWGYFGQGRPRPEYHNTYAAGKSIVNDTHNHGMSEARHHKHTITHAGTGRPFDLAQPTILFRVEMKIK